MRLLQILLPTTVLSYKLSKKKAVFMRKNSLQEHYCFNRPQAWQVWRALDGRKEVNLCRLRSLRDSRSGIRHDFVIETWGNNLKIMNLSG